MAQPTWYAGRWLSTRLPDQEEVRQNRAGLSECKLHDRVDGRYQSIEAEATGAGQHKVAGPRYRPRVKHWWHVPVQPVYHLGGYHAEKDKQQRKKGYAECSGTK